jgi:catechol 2,3-dioxygenase-like lactoylglutathione lyase family enzyme
MNSIAEIAYFTADVQALSDFYSAVLDSQPAAQSEGLAVFMVDNTKIFIHHKYQPAEDELPPENHIALAVQNLDEFCKTLMHKGYALEVPPASYYWGRSAYLRDPEGRLLELNEPPSEQA